MQSKTARQIHVSLSAVVVTALALTIIPQQYALAYIDPGTGTWLLQIIAAVSISAVFMLQAFWKRITGFFKRIFQKKRP